MIVEKGIKTSHGGPLQKVFWVRLDSVCAARENTMVNKYQERILKVSS